jgi:hypothetical protein
MKHKIVSIPLPSHGLYRTGATKLTLAGQIRDIPAGKAMLLPEPKDNKERARIASSVNHVKQKTGLNLVTRLIEHEGKVMLGIWNLGKKEGV